WSSDVCSSDLRVRARGNAPGVSAPWPIPRPWTLPSRRSSPLALSFPAHAGFAAATPTLTPTVLQSTSRRRDYFATLHGDFGLSIWLSQIVQSREAPRAGFEPAT